MQVGLCVCPVMYASSIIPLGKNIRLANEELWTRCPSILLSKSLKQVMKHCALWRIWKHTHRKTSLESPNQNPNRRVTSTNRCHLAFVKCPSCKGCKNLKPPRGHPSRWVVSSFQQQLFQASPSFWIDFLFPRFWLMGDFFDTCLASPKGLSGSCVS